MNYSTPQLPRLSSIPIGDDDRYRAIGDHVRTIVMREVDAQILDEIRAYQYEVALPGEGMSVGFLIRSLRSGLAHYEYTDSLKIHRTVKESHLANYVFAPVKSGGLGFGVRQAAAMIFLDGIRRYVECLGTENGRLPVQLTDYTSKHHSRDMKDRAYGHGWITDVILSQPNDLSLGDLYEKCANKLLPGCSIRVGSKTSLSNGINVLGREMNALRSIWSRITDTIDEWLNSGAALLNKPYQSLAELDNDTVHAPDDRIATLERLLQLCLREVDQPEDPGFLLKATQPTHQGGSTRNLSWDAYWSHDLHGSARKQIRSHPSDTMSAEQALRYETLAVIESYLFSGGDFKTQKTPGQSQPLYRSYICGIGLGQQDGSAVPAWMGAAFLIGSYSADLDNPEANLRRLGEQLRSALRRNRQRIEAMLTYAKKNDLFSSFATAVWLPGLDGDVRTHFLKELVKRPRDFTDVSLHAWAIEADGKLPVDKKARCRSCLNKHCPNPHVIVQRVLDALNTHDPEAVTFSDLVFELTKERRDGRYLSLDQIKECATMEPGDAIALTDEVNGLTDEAVFNRSTHFATIPIIVRERDGKGVMGLRLRGVVQAYLDLKGGTPGNTAVEQDIREQMQIDAGLKAYGLFSEIAALYQLALLRERSDKTRERDFVSRRFLDIVIDRLTHNLKGAGPQAAKSKLAAALDSLAGGSPMPDLGQITAHVEGALADLGHLETALGVLRGNLSVRKPITANELQSVFGTIETCLRPKDCGGVSSAVAEVPGRVAAEALLVGWHFLLNAFAAVSELEHVPRRVWHELRADERDGVPVLRLTVGNTLRTEREPEVNRGRDQELINALWSEHAIAAPHVEQHVVSITDENGQYYSLEVSVDIPIIREVAH